MMDGFNAYVISSFPKEAGFYVIGGRTKFAIYQKPSWLHRTACRLILGWAWEDKVSP